MRSNEIGGRGGQVKFYSYKRGGGKSFSNAERWVDTKYVEVVLTWVLELLVTWKGGTTSFHPLKVKGGAQQVIPCLEGGTTCFKPMIFPFRSPSSPLSMTSP